MSSESTGTADRAFADTLREGVDARRGQVHMASMPLVDAKLVEWMIAMPTLLQQLITALAAGSR